MVQDPLSRHGMLDLKLPQPGDEVVDTGSAGGQYAPTSEHLPISLLMSTQHSPRQRRIPMIIAGTSCGYSAASTRVTCPLRAPEDH